MRLCDNSIRFHMHSMYIYILHKYTCVNDNDNRILRKTILLLVLFVSFLIPIIYIVTQVIGATTIGHDARVDELKTKKNFFQLNNIHFCSLYICFDSFSFLSLLVHAFNCFCLFIYFSLFMRFYVHTQTGRSTGQILCYTTKQHFFCYQK